MTDAPRESYPDIVERLQEYSVYGDDAKVRLMAALAKDEIKRLRTNAEYWRLLAERREARTERTGLDIPEAETLDAPQPASVAQTPTKEDFAKWSRVWHDTCETMVTLLGLPGSGSPQELLAQVQAYVGTRPVAQGVQQPSDELVRLVIAARVVAFQDQSPDAIRELDEASEAFAEIVPWDDEPADLRTALTALFLSSTVPSHAAQDILAGLDGRLDRLLLTASDNSRFVLSTESAKNIVGIVREWIRSRGSEHTSTQSGGGNAK